ncbi:MAG: phosphodiester glycosidase family protein [Chloroflexota bacterium]|nr:phosphodiester glycosidase family protein [Chloroflexota bacterium]
MTNWLRNLLTLSGAQPPRSMGWLHRVRLAPFLTPPLMAILSLLGGCMLTSATPAPSPTTTDAWQSLAPGLERRFLNPATFVSFTALRIDPALFTFRVHYSPGDALNLTEWRARLLDAVAIFNANFFDRNENALGLVVADGIAYGSAYTDRGGMLQVQNGVVRVRSTIEEPYLGEPLEQAAQAFPMLVTNGAAAFSNPRGDYAARRTLVAQDTSGRIIVLASSSLLGMSLVNLSAYLPTTDFDIANAVNFDGGGSTLLAIYPPDGSAALIPSFDPVTVVIAAYPR